MLVFSADLSHTTRSPLLSVMVVEDYAWNLRFVSGVAATAMLAGSFTFCATEEEDNLATGKSSDSAAGFVVC